MKKKQHTATHARGALRQSVQRQAGRGPVRCPPSYRALKDYARANGYSVARKYVDEAESGRVANRPQFREMIEEGSKPKAPFEVISGLEIQPLHQEARARSGLQVPTAAQGHPRGVHHRAGRGQRHRQAP